MLSWLMVQQIRLNTQATDSEVTDSLLNLIQYQMKGLKESIKAKGKIERELESCSVQLNKVKADYHVILCYVTKFQQSSHIDNCSYYSIQILFEFVALGCFGNSGGQ